LTLIMFVWFLEIYIGEELRRERREDRLSMPEEICVFSWRGPRQTTVVSKILRLSWSAQK